jgi:glucose/arabinose dehydrogenase
MRASSRNFSSLCFSANQKKSRPAKIVGGCWRNCHDDVSKRRITVFACKEFPRDIVSLPLPPFSNNKINNYSSTAKQQTTSNTEKKNRSNCKNSGIIKKNGFLSLSSSSHKTIDEDETKIIVITSNNMAEIKGHPDGEFASSLQASGSAMTADERRRLRQEKKRKLAQERTAESGTATASGNRLSTADSDERFAKLLAKDEDQLLEMVARINKVYEQKLKKDAPFMTFVLCGM